MPVDSPQPTPAHSVARGVDREQGSPTVSRCPSARGGEGGSKLLKNYSAGAFDAGPQCRLEAFTDPHYLWRRGAGGGGGGLGLAEPWRGPQRRSDMHKKPSDVTSSPTPSLSPWGPRNRLTLFVLIHSNALKYNIIQTHGINRTPHHDRFAFASPEVKVRRASEMELAI